MSLELIRTEQFNGIDCAFYQNETKNIWVTRKQIGEALEYVDPQRSMDKLHAAHKSRFDQFSVTAKLAGTDGKLYNTMIYSAKGIYEACRWSRQPKADAFYDWVYDVVETIRSTGMYIANDSQGEALVANYLSMSPVDRAILYFTTLKTEETKSVQLESLSLEQVANQPKVEAFNDLMDSTGLMLIGTAAKACGYGPIKIFGLLKEKRVLFDHNSNRNIPYQQYIDNGYFVLKIRKIDKPSGIKVEKYTTYVTPKGVAFIHRLCKKQDDSVLIADEANFVDPD